MCPCGKKIINQKFLTSLHIYDRMVKKDNKSGKVPMVERFVDLVEYQKEAVVSRTLIDKVTGTVTLFAFDEGQGLSEHTTPYDALVNILDGEADITISGVLYELKEGDIITMPADEPHALRARKAFKMMLVMIKS